MRLKYLGYDAATQTARLELLREDPTDQIESFISYLQGKPLEGPETLNFEISLKASQEKIFTLLHTKEFRDKFLQYSAGSDRDAAKILDDFLQTVPKAISSPGVRKVIPAKKSPPAKNRAPILPVIEEEPTALSEQKNVRFQLGWLQTYLNESRKKSGLALQNKTDKQKVVGAPVPELKLTALDTWLTVSEVLEDAQDAVDNNNIHDAEKHFKKVIDWMQLTDIEKTESRESLNLIAIDLCSFFTSIKENPTVASNHDDLLAMLPETLKTLVSEQTSTPGDVATVPAILRFG